MWCEETSHSIHLYGVGGGVSYVPGIRPAGLLRNGAYETINNAQEGNFRAEERRGKDIGPPPAALTAARAVPRSRGGTMKDHQLPLESFAIE